MDLFDKILYTSDLPHAKPHPSVFLEAARRLDTDPAACVMVGDDPLGDVSGARRVGMKAILKRTDRPHADTKVSAPDAIVTHLSEVPALLRRGFG